MMKLVNITCTAWAYDPLIHLRRFHNKRPCSTLGAHFFIKNATIHVNHSMVNLVIVTKQPFQLSVIGPIFERHLNVCVSDDKTFQGYRKYKNTLYWQMYKILTGDVENKVKQNIGHNWMQSVNQMAKEFEYHMVACQSLQITNNI